MLLALDPATAFGWARFDGKVLDACGCWYLPKGLVHERWEALRYHLSEEGGGCETIAFERVHAHTGVHAAQIYGGTVAIIQQWCADFHKRCIPVSVQAGKKAISGSARATKEDSVYAVFRRFGLNVTHDVADAIGIGLAVSI